MYRANQLGWSQNHLRGGHDGSMSACLRRQPHHARTTDSKSIRQKWRACTLFRAQTFSQRGSVFHGVCSPLLSKIRRRRLGQRSNTDGSFLPELRSTKALACAKSLCPLAHTGEVRNNHTALVHPSIFGRFGDGTCPQRCRRLWCSSPVTE